MQERKGHAMIKMSPRRIRNLNMSRSVGLSTVVPVESQRFPTNINVLHWFSSPFRCPSPYDSRETSKGGEGWGIEERDAGSEMRGNWNGNVSVREINLRGSEIRQKGTAPPPLARWMLWNLRKIEHAIAISCSRTASSSSSSISSYIKFVDSTSMTVIHSSPTRLTCV